jgi:hypothetical protein
MMREWGICPNRRVYPFDIIFRSACSHILNDHRAILNTGAASGTTIFNDRTGLFSNFDLEIAGGALYAFKICIGNKFNV